MAVTIKMTVRMPLQVHNALNNAADQEGKSLNQLIVERLNASVGGVYLTEDQANDSGLVERVKKLECDVLNLTNRIGSLSVGS